MRDQSWVSVADAAEVTVRGQVAQMMGLRLLFAFPISVRSRPFKLTHTTHLAMAALLWLHCYGYIAVAALLWLHCCGCG